MEKYTPIALTFLMVLVLSGCQKEEDKVIEIPTLNSYFSPKDKTAPPVTLVSEDDMNTRRIGAWANEVQVQNIMENQFVSSPLTVRGVAPGPWFFEAVAPLEILNDERVILGTGFVKAKGEWMTVNNVDFDGTISFAMPEGASNNNGWLVLKNANPSGETENDASVEIPILFEKP